MSFGNPAGLWLLLLIPLLILIYILRSRYENKHVSSTYIWQLSDKFLKQKLPLHRFTRLLLFLLQLALIALFALAAAKPSVEDGFGKDYVVLLDCSAGMQVKNEEGVSRFDRALAEIEELSKELSGGHTLTVICAGQKASYLIKATDSSIKVKTALEDAHCKFGVCNTEAALALAAEAGAELSAPQVLFYTHQDYENVDGITVKNLSSDEWNLSFLGLSAEKEDKLTRFTAKLVSHNRDTELTVGLKIDGKTVDAKSLSLVKDTPTELLFEYTEQADFDRAEVFADTKDGLKEDDFYALCPNRDRCKVLLAGTTPFYIEKALTALGSCEITRISSFEDAPLSGYNLYIFDGIAPEELPSDGGVLLFGTEKMPDGLVCSSFKDEEGRLSVDEELAHPLFANVSPFGCYVKGYTPLMGTAEWTFPMYCGGNAVFAIKNSEKEHFLALCSFDLHDSNLPLMLDFVALMGNIVTENLPSLVKSRDFCCEDTVSLSLPFQATQLYLEEPNGEVRTLSFSEECANAPVSIPGIYTAVVTTIDEQGVYADFFVHIPEGEGEKTVSEPLSLLLPEKEEESARIKTRGIWSTLALVLLALLLIEWGVYFRDRY
ncbi:MAG: BatA domain-containing protein [Clostridia bacterium]|nr:BatA domain-containing protein [Clostridia bacterium]